jgi:chromosome partitioning protein
MRSIGFISEKGGTGKSTSAINVAACAARQGLRTLVCDLDPQANATLVLLAGQQPAAPTAVEVLLATSRASAAVVSIGDRLSLMPATAALAEVNLALVGELGRERRLRNAFEELADDYDLIVVDTPPTKSLLSVNALNAVQDVIAPVSPGLFSLAGLGQIQNTVEEVRRFLDNRSLRLAGIVLTMVERTSVARDVEAQVREAFGELVFPTVIHRAVKIEESHSRYQSVIDFAPRSAGAAEYMSLTQEILGHGQANRTRERTGGTHPTHHAA